MEEEKRKAYSEVVEVLKLIENEQKIEQIPFEVIQLIKTNSDPTYKPNISKEIPLEEQNLRNETYSILGWIASKYWGEDVEVASILEQKNTTQQIEKADEIKNIESEENTEDTIRNASVYNDIEPECLERKNLPILMSDISWYERIKAKVIRILKIIFRIKNKEEKEVSE